MMKDVGARFVQSAGEFPLSVRLGKKGPSWELRRWGRDTLGFLPLAEGGYSTRGDRRRVHYKGDGVSHRFTILDNEHFEYDIILNKEPEGNRLYLGVQGWEGFDFFRQPDDLGPDILRGSYAVYKKEGVINSLAYHVGTGKICHIHRPRIIDARGRRVWGNIWIDRGVMTMTIPEWWLADARYPVVVDPVVGSSVAGAYNSYEYMTQEGYEWYLGDKAMDPSVQLEQYVNMRPVEFIEGVVFNKYKTPEPLQGVYNTCLYIDKIPVIQGYSYDDYDVAPLLYSNDNNHPKYLLNYDSDFVSIISGLFNPGNFTPRWLQTTMMIFSSIAANTDVWFGHCGRNGAMRFDYGTPFFQSQNYSAYSSVKEEYGAYFEMALDRNLYDISDMEDELSGDRANVYPGARYDMKVSMYLALPASYKRTVTQWVKPAETRKLTGKYQRSAEQTVRGTAVANRFEGFCRSVVQTVKNTISLKGSPTLIRKVVEAVAALYETKAGAGFKRGMTDTAGIGSMTGGAALFFRTLFGLAGSGDNTGSFSTRMRLIQDTETIGDETGHTADYLRGLFVEAGGMAGTTRRGEYYRIQQDTAGNEAVPLRHLFIFLRLLTGAYIRDYIIGRFLKSKEEVIIKSHVCREITLDSTLH